MESDACLRVRDHGGVAIYSRRRIGGSRTDAVCAPPGAGDDVVFPLNGYAGPQHAAKKIELRCAESLALARRHADGTVIFDEEERAVFAGLDFCHVTFLSPNTRQLPELFLNRAPVAFEPPSAGFVLDWRSIASMADRGVEFAIITHAAGISSTADPELDGLLPFNEPYRIPESTARAIERTRMRQGRVIAVGTTVVRALEHAAFDGCIRPGEGVANQRIGPASRLSIIDAILSGTHQPGTSHYELLRAFAPDALLCRMDRELEANQYKTHEFGDSVLVERQDRVTVSNRRASIS